MEEIPLTQNKVALVDDEDFGRLSAFRWRTLRIKRTFYAARHIQVGKKWTTLLMHVEIMGAKGIDHRDGNGLNNCRSNLRIASPTQNNRNRQKGAGTSLFKGVYWEKSLQKWRAQIRVNGQKFSLGRFENETKAAYAYDAAAIQFFGVFARLNFPERKR